MEESDSHSVPKEHPEQTVTDNLIESSISSVRGKRSRSGSDSTSNASESGKSPNSPIYQSKPPRMESLDEKDSKLLETLPTCEKYQKSYMHGSFLTQIVSSDKYLITSSKNGQFQYWIKKDLPAFTSSKEELVPGISRGSKDTFTKTTTDGIIEFAKSLHTKQKNIVGTTVSPDSSYLFSLDSDSLLQMHTIDLFDVHFQTSLKSVSISAPLSIVAGKSVTPNSDVSSDIVIIGFRDGAIAIFDIEEILEYMIEPFIIRPHGDNPVFSIGYNPISKSFISASPGNIMYWSIEHNIDSLTKSIILWGNYSEYPFSFDPNSDSGFSTFQKQEAIPLSLTVSKNGTRFVVSSLVGRCIKYFVFDYFSGSLMCMLPKVDEKIDENAPNFQAILDAESQLLVSLIKWTSRIKTPDSDDRLSTKLWNNILPRADFDPSGQIVMFPTFSGIHYYSIRSDTILKTIGTEESPRFVSIYLWSGITHYQSKNTPFCILCASGFQSNRFYLFTSHDPREILTTVSGATIIPTIRDIWNEKTDSYYGPGLVLRNIAQISESGDSGESEDALSKTILSYPSSSNSHNHNGVQSTTKDGTMSDAEIIQYVTKLCLEATLTNNNPKVVLFTNIGDIKLEIYPTVKKAAINFLALVKKGYYNNVIFHRVIKRFMIQTGDPTGFGTGGQSIWGKPFYNEIFPRFKHYPFTLSMANTGSSCSNLSQFFITTVRADWLDGKHSVFGKVISGKDIVTKIEYSPVNPSTQKPLTEFKIISALIVE